MSFDFLVNINVWNIKCSHKWVVYDRPGECSCEKKLTTIAKVILTVTMNCNSSVGGIKSDQMFLLLTGVNVRRIPLPWCFFFQFPFDICKAALHYNNLRVAGSLHRFDLEFLSHFYVLK